MGENDAEGILSDAVEVATVTLALSENDGTMEEC